MILTAAALAQEAAPLEVQRFRPSATSATLLWVDSVGGPTRLQTRALLHWASDPLVYEDDLGQRDELISDLAQLDLLAAGGVGPLRVGVDLPVVLLRAGSLPSESGLGPIRGEVQLAVVDRAVGLGLSARGWAPTATAGSWTSDGLEGELAAMVDGQVGPVLLAANLGTSVAPRVELEGVTLDDGLVARVGGSVELGRGAGLGLELAGRAPYSAPLDAPGALHAEWLLSGFGPLDHGFGFRVAGGTALTAGIGAPDVRLLLGGTWSPPAPSPVDPDPDGDGLAEETDACPEQAEDLDGVRDADGCPEPELPLVVRLLGEDGAPLPAGRTELVWGSVLIRGGADQAFELLPGPWTLRGLAPGRDPVEQALDLGEGSSLDLRLPARSGGAFAVAGDRLIPTPDAGEERLLDEVAAELALFPEIRRLTIGGPAEPAEALRDGLLARGVAAERVRVEPAEGALQLRLAWEP